MAIKPICDKCKSELKDFGGLIFSPPDKKGRAKKWHLCKNCYKDLEKVLGS